MEKGVVGMNEMSVSRGETERVLRALSHDMRAPLKNVIALAQLSLDALAGGDRPEGETVTPYLRKILIAAHELELLTGDLMKDGQEDRREERFTANELAEAVSVTIGAQAREREQLLCIDVSGLGDCALTADRAALDRILANLMGNAIKYTHTGGRISLTARVLRRDHSGVEAEFIVEDNGMGMTPEFLARMYEPFTRSPQALAQAIPGNGIGLAIVKRLTERMRGSIDVQSEWGKGTRFSLRVPLHIARQEAKRTETAASLTGKRFLLAEDNDLSAEIAQALLSGKGASVRRAANGRQAVQLFRSLPAGTFDAILMDMRMPQMGGCSAAAEIRGMQRADAGRIPILALTAGGDAQDERMAKAAGMNACLQKPLDLRRLCEAMGDEGLYRDRLV